MVLVDANQQRMKRNCMLLVQTCSDCVPEDGKCVSSLRYWFVSLASWLL